MQVEIWVQKHMYYPLALDGRCSLSCIILDKKHAPSFWTGSLGAVSDCASGLRQRHQAQIIVGALIGMA